MKTPLNVLHFNQQSWMPAVKNLQRLQDDFSTACHALGVPHAAAATLLLEQGTLNLKTSAVLGARLRQIAPELKSILNGKAWQIDALNISVVRDAQGLSQHVQTAAWLNPNEVRYGKRQAPTPEQRAVILTRLKRQRPAIKTSLAIKPS